jgi:hypothetical protein
MNSPPQLIFCGRILSLGYTIQGCDRLQSSVYFLRSIRLAGLLLATGLSFQIWAACVETGKPAPASRKVAIDCLNRVYRLPSIRSSLLARMRTGNTMESPFYLLSAAARDREPEQLCEI